MMLPVRPTASVHPMLAEAAKQLAAAQNCGAATIFMAGGHVVRSGAQPYLIDLMKRGFLTCIAVNGAVAIHDFELALVGATTENVGRYIAEGQFGLWRETGRINDIVSDASSRQMGLGEAVGAYIWENDLPNRELSLLGSAYHLGITVTVHVGIGYDIVAEHPNYSGAAYGDTSYRDFLRFTDEVTRLEGGVVMNFGSAVMAPEIYLKALAMARNKARKEGKRISHFTTLVGDLVDLPADFSKEPSKDDPRYYFRPWKTMLCRTVRDGGTSLYVKMPHKESIPMLWTAVNALEKAGENG